MSSTRFDPTSARYNPAPQVPTQGGVQVASARVRQTEAPASPFRAVLAGSAGALLTGAEVAASVIGGPVMAAAVHQAKTDVMSRMAGGSSAGAGGSAAGQPGEDPLARAYEIQQQSQIFNVELLNFQEQIQNENRRFTTISNVSRVMHDTASACVKNIH